MKELLGFAQIGLTIIACICLFPVAPLVSCLLGATIFLELGYAMAETSRAAEKDDEEED